MTLGEKIQTLRKQNNFNQEQLADKLFISRQAVSKWENNESQPDLENILRISEIFNVSTDYLLKDGATYNTNSQNNNTNDTNIAIPIHSQPTKPRKKRIKLRDYDSDGIYMLAAVIYLILGFTFNLWHPGWLIFPIAAAIATFLRI